MQISGVPTQDVKDKGLSNIFNPVCTVSVVYASIIIASQAEVINFSFFAEWSWMGRVDNISSKHTAIDLLCVTQVVHTQMANEIVSKFTTAIFQL